MNPDHVHKETREQADQALFDRVADQYSKKDSTASSSLARESQLLTALKPVLEQVPTLGTVVDIGCGVGAPAQYLVDHYERYIGIDQSKSMIEAARRFNRQNPKAQFLIRNVKSSDLPLNEADLVLSIGALHHMTELSNVMDSLVRIAKPEAFMVIIEPQNGNPLLQVMRWVRSVVDSSYSRGQAFFSEKDLTDLLASHGVTNPLVDFQGFLSPPFAQVIMRPQALVTPISRMASRVDTWLAKSLPRSLKKLAFNIVIIARFTK